jgi:hypothetical protein
MVIYKNIVFYNGIFYTDQTNIEISYTHNRLKENKYLFSPSDINTIELIEPPIQFNTGVLLLDHFHFNPAHNMWDHLYPSWYGLFKYLNDYSNNGKFQYITKMPMDNIFGIQHINLIEIFSGNKPISLNEFTNKFNKPLLIPWLIIGLDGIGISHINKNDLIVKRGPEINNTDPIELFVNRTYSRYNIKRNSLVDKLNINECNNVIFIKNKRPYNGIEELFNKMNDKYKGKYNFKIIDYSNYDFEQQLCILNTTCLCIAGIGSARFNTPFLPNGAIEIQIFQPHVFRTNYIEYLDYHAGTLSKYIKVKNIPYYTKEEASNNSCSHLLETYIDDALIEIPCKVPINLEENIPIEIRNLKYHKNYDEKFDIWRNNLSNIVEDFMNIL